MAYGAESGATDDGGRRISLNKTRRGAIWHGSHGFQQPVGTLPTGRCRVQLAAPFSSCKRQRQRVPAMRRPPNLRFVTTSGGGLIHRSGCPLRPLSAHLPCAFPFVAFVASVASRVGLRARQPARSPAGGRVLQMG
jgi:hypothetical protein